MAPPPAKAVGPTPTIFQTSLASSGVISIADTLSRGGQPPIPVDDDAETLRPTPVMPTTTGGGGGGAGNAAAQQERPPPIEVDLAADDDHMPVEEAPRTPSRRSAPYGRESPAKQARPTPVTVSLALSIATPQPPHPYPIVMPPASLPSPPGAPPEPPAAPHLPAPTTQGYGQPATTTTHILMAPEPSAREIMTLLQQILNDQMQDRDAISERFIYVQHGLDHVNRRLDGHEGHLTALEQRINEQASAALERATAAEARTIAAANAQFNQLQAKITALEERQQKLAVQRPPSSSSTSPDFHLVVAGFKRETPKDTIDKITRTVLSTTPAGTKMLRDADSLASSSSSSPAWEVYAPYVLGSICLIKCPMESQDRQLLAQVRGAFGREVVAAGQTLRLYISVQKTKPERDRNKRLTTIAATVQQAVSSSHKASQEQAWRLVCWISACIIVGEKRVASLARMPEDKTTIDETT